MRRKHARLRSAETGNSMRLSRSPGCKIFWWLPVTNCSIGTCRSPPSRDRIVQIRLSATAKEIMEPAGSDMKMFTQTVAVFQILNDDSGHREHWLIERVGRHSREVATDTTT